VSAVSFVMVVAGDGFALGLILTRDRGDAAGDPSFASMICNPLAELGPLQESIEDHRRMSGGELHAFSNGKGC